VFGAEAPPPPQATTSSEAASALADREKWESFLRIGIVSRHRFIRQSGRESAFFESAFIDGKKIGFRLQDVPRW
jgi:hypothetical protein